MINDAIIGVAILCILAIAYLYLAKWLEDRQAARLKAQRDEYKRKERAEMERQCKVLDEPIEWPKKDEFKPDNIDWRNYTDTGKLEVRHETYTGEMK